MVAALGTEGKEVLMSMQSSSLSPVRWVEAMEGKGKGGGGAQDGGESGGGGVGASGKSATAACALFGSPRLLHCASLPFGSHTKNSDGGGGGSEPETSYLMSPMSVLDSTAAFVPSSDVGGSKCRPWCDRGAGTHGLANALDCTNDDDDGHKRSVLTVASQAVKVHAQQQHHPLLRSCSLDRRVEFGIKNKSSWLLLRGGGGSAEDGAHLWPIDM